MELKRKNRLWEPRNLDIQATMCLCEKCGEGYEAGREHVCREVNSYPAREKCMALGFRATIFGG